jgi:hypothetical protein
MRRAAVLAFLVAAGCDEELARPEIVANLRVLAIRAEPPEARPGAEVTLEGLVVTPDESSEVERLWLACVAAPGAGVPSCVEGASGLPACDASPEARLCLLGGGATARYRVPEVALAGRPPGQDGQVLVGLIAAERARGGVTGCLEAFVARGEVPDPCRVAVKRLTVLASERAPNANPRIERLHVAGAALLVELAPGAAEATPDGPEPLFFSWFVTAGELDAFRTDLDGGDEGLSNLWTPPDVPGRVVVVVRDGRGGEGWMEGRR